MAAGFTVRELTQLKENAIQNNFFDVRYIQTPVISSEFREFYKQYLRAGFHGDMGYLKNFKNIKAKFNLQKIFPGVKSVAVFYHPYNSDEVESNLKNFHYKISRFAWGRDYHKIIQKKIKDLVKDLGDCRVVCDTTPLPERYLALLSGFGFIGKNTLLIHPQAGSYFLMGFALFKNEIPADLLEEAGIYDNKFSACGGCTKCIDACPGGALGNNGYLDAGRCFSYWSIENKEEKISHSFQNMPWIYGCDICQEVCPYNKQSIHTSEEDFKPKNISRKIAAGDLNFNDEDLKGTAFYRQKKKGLIRNLEYIKRFRK